MDINNKWDNIICGCVGNDNNLLGILTTSLTDKNRRLIFNLTSGNWIYDNVIHNNSSNFSFAFDDCDFWLCCRWWNYHLLLVIISLYNPSWGLVIRAWSVNHNNFSCCCDIFTVSIRNEYFGFLSGGNVRLNIDNVTTLVLDCDNIARIIDNRGEWRDNIIFFHFWWSDINIDMLFRNYHRDWLVWSFGVVNNISVNRCTIVNLDNWGFLTRDYNSANLGLCLSVSHSYFFNFSGRNDSNLEILTCIINHNSDWLFRITDVGWNNIDSWFGSNRILLFYDNNVLTDRNLNKYISLVLRNWHDLNRLRTRSCRANLCNVTIIVVCWLPSLDWLKSHGILNLGRDNFLRYGYHLFYRWLWTTVVYDKCWIFCDYNSWRAGFSNVNWSHLNVIYGDNLSAFVIINNLDNSINIASSINKDCLRTISISRNVNSRLDSAGVDQNDRGICGYWWLSIRYDIFNKFFDWLNVIMGFNTLWSWNLSESSFF